LVTEDNVNLGSGQLLNYSRDSYLERTSRPIYAILFLLPFIIFYELGTLIINTDVLARTQVRVVAFVWLQRGLEYIGLGGKFAWMTPPLVVIVILVFMQLAGRKSWRVSIADVVPMALECIIFAGPLLVLSLFLNSSVEVNAAISQGGDGATAHSLMADIVTGIGAGIYEELVFRLILMCLLIILFQDVMRINHRLAITLSVLVSAALFSAHHHVLFVDGQFTLTAPFTGAVFIFRTLAGVYFATIFAVRGFGITAGTHAFYDIIATIVNAVFFSGGDL